MRPISKMEIANRIYLEYSNEDNIPFESDEAFKEGVIAGIEFTEKLIKDYLNSYLPNNINCES